MQHKYIVIIDSPSFIEKATVAEIILDTLGANPDLYISEVQFGPELDGGI